MEGPGVCYCGAYGGGVHTLSSRCPKPEKPDPQLAGELFALIEGAQGASYISDGIGVMTRHEIRRAAIAARYWHQRCVELLDGFEKRFSESTHLER